MKKLTCLFACLVMASFMACSQSEMLNNSHPGLEGQIPVTPETYISTFGIYSETIPMNVVWGSTVNWARQEYTSTIAEQSSVVFEGSKAWKITAGTSGWTYYGAQKFPLYTYTDLSSYSTGYMSFLVKSKVLISIGMTTGVNPRSKMFILSNGNYGFYADNNWRSVTIPMRIFTGLGLDLKLVQRYFTIYSSSSWGFTPGSVIYLDKIFFHR